MGNNPFIPRVCEQCAVTFYVYPARLRQGPARYCSKPCESLGRRAAHEPLFWAKVAVCAHGLNCPYCCWPWTGFIRKNGYGATTKFNRPFPAYRRAWEYWNRQEMPLHLEACHYCHTPVCVNPAHIHPGTRQDNRTESVIAGHFPVGEARANTKLTVAQVLLIRQWHREGIGPYVISKRIGISNATVHAILQGRVWKHAP
jgi:hypothetical protein